MTLVPNVSESVILTPLKGDWSLANPDAMVVIKRDGHEVPYDSQKIYRATERCMISCHRSEADASRIATQVMDQVEHILRLKAVGTRGVEPLSIEVIQNIVEIQLMALGLHDAAKHYILYRDERRRLREEASRISPELQEKFKEGCSYFSGVNHLIREAQYFDKFSRFNWDRGRREYWLETVDRTMDYFRKHAQNRFPDAVSEETWRDLREGLARQEATPSLRSVQMAGPALERCQVGVFSCAYTEMDSPESLAEDLYMLMSGVGVGFSVEEDIVDRWDRVEKQKRQAPVTYIVEDDTEAWCDALKHGLHTWIGGGDVEFDLSLVRPKGSILRTKGGRACLTADTVVYKDRKKDTGSNTITIGELYEKRIKTPRRLKLIQIRCLDEETGTFQRNHIVDVVDNGIADVYEVKTEAGYRIKATCNHRFMNSEREYQHLSEFLVGDYIAVNGTDLSDRKSWIGDQCLSCGKDITRGTKSRMCQSCVGKANKCVNCDGRVSGSSPSGLCRDCRDKDGVCVDCGKSISRRADRCRRCADIHQTKDDARPTSARQRKDCRAAAVASCHICGRDDIRTEVHHRDQNVYNNSPDNLWNLCSPCHQHLHAVERTYGNPYSHKYLSFDRVISIEHVGQERVFDLCMKSPNHNFVANGFVSHNSGPGPLRDLLTFARGTILRRQGRKLRTIDIHDMTCMTHRIGQMGGVRRASGLSASSRDDILMRHAKDGTFYNEHPYRNQANNAAVYEEKPTAVEFMEEWLSLAKSGSGERGILNREGMTKQNPPRRKKARWGFNPCGETILYRNFCNLSISIASNCETVDNLRRKVRLATLWGTLQASMTRFRYLRPFWKENTEEEALLGVDILGHMDCDLLRPGSPGREGLLQSLLQDVQGCNQDWSRRIGINPGAALTVCKPSGDSSVLFNKPAGFKAHHGRYYIRRMRFSQINPISKVLQEAGVPWEHEYDKSGNVVFEFPCESPEGAIVLGDQNAVEQLENWKTWKVNFTEHNPSATIVVKEHEWFATGHWVYENWDIVGGLSFLPFDGGIYPQAPYQTITEEEYNQRMSAMPTEIDWSRVMLYEQSDMTELSSAFACTGGGCEI